VTILVFIIHTYTWHILLMKVVMRMERGGSTGRSLDFSVAVLSLFLILLAFQDQAFCLSASLPGPHLAVDEVWWQTGTLVNRAGVVPVRLNTVYALNRLQLTGLEPGHPHNT